METKTKKQIFKDYLLSTIISFLTGFAMYIVSDQSLSTSSVSDGVLLGALFAASRAGIKAVIEYFVMKAQTKVS